MLPQYRPLYRASPSYQESTRVQLIHAVAGLKPVTRVLEPLDESTTAFFDQAGFNLDIYRNPSSRRKGRTLIWNEKRVNEILGQAGYSYTTFDDQRFSELDVRTRGILCGYHSEEIDYWSGFCQESEGGIQHIVNSFELVKKWESRSRYNTLGETIVPDFDYLSYDYILTPPGYGADLERLIERRAHAVKVIDHTLYNRHVRSNLERRLTVLFDGSLAQDHESIIENGFTTAPEFKRVQAFAEAVYKQLDHFPWISPARGYPHARLQPQPLIRSK
jgi:hypothetical protein